jgi:hypothetical protein
MKTLKHKLVEYIPGNIEEGILYISMEHCVAIHLCICGCGNKVVTPISPTDWQLTYDGKTISLFPSIGNWSFNCESHYWITKNRVEFARKWSKKEIKKFRKNQSSKKEKHFKKGFWKWISNKKLAIFYG